jgi:hypothetical protein
MNLLSPPPHLVRTRPKWEMAQSAKRVWPTADEPAKEEEEEEEKCLASAGKRAGAQNVRARKPLRATDLELECILLNTR